MIFKKLKTISDIKLEENTNLARFTTMRIQVKGSILIVQTPEALEKSLKLLKESNYKYHLIGWGANQVIIHTDNILFIKLDFLFDEASIDLKNLYFPASISLNKLTKIAKKFYLDGWEVFSGIPASLGGAVAMNAGTRLGEMKDLIQNVHIISKDGQRKIIEGKDLKFIYRQNNFLNEGDIILGATLKFNKIDIAVVQKITDYLSYRSRTQPLNTKNCGCIFKNPSPEMPAGKIIDELGLKGKEYKGLRISRVHGNFIENFAEAKAEDFYTFVHEIKQIVRDRRGIEFEFEVKLI